MGRLLAILRRTAAAADDVVEGEVVGTYPRPGPVGRPRMAPIPATGPAVHRRRRRPSLPHGHRLGRGGTDITDGFPDGTFRPGRHSPARRWSRSSTDCRAPRSTVTDPGFADVDADHPFRTAIAWAAANDITDGFPDGTFRPGADVTRQALAAFLYRLAGEPDGPLPATGYTDVDTGHPFVTEIRWAAYTEITQGYPDNTFRSTTGVTRQATAAFLYRLEPLLPVESP
ncbi:MAG: S-layer homology domain-containing protein [Acidimicrobiia bacterium]|nr:S-layer homology domain-containing protein [Acidimicrobiia bacterium]